MLSVPDRLALQHLRRPLQPDALADEIVLEDAIIAGVVVREAFEELRRVWQTLGEFLDGVEEDPVCSSSVELWLAWVAEGVRT